MAKAPKNLPEVGDRVRLRGRETQGTLRRVDPGDVWSWVDWDVYGIAPRICHLWELEKAEQR